MNFDEFKEYVEKNIKAFLPERYAGSITDVTEIQKNNGITLNALSIRLDGMNTTPALYLEPYFDEYKNGDTLDNVMKKIAQMQLFAESKDSFNISAITIWDNCKHNVYPKLINRECNKELLKALPHFDLCDLSITFFIELGASFEDAATVQITESILKIWGLTSEQLLNQAMENLHKEVILRPMIDVIHDLIPDYALESSVDNVLWIATNRLKMYGAAAILEKSFLKKAAEIIGEEFYILPSSIHECIFVKTDGIQSKDLQSMVAEVNTTQVDKKDFLSNNVYLYSNGNIKIALA